MLAAVPLQQPCSSSPVAAAHFASVPINYHPFHVACPGRLDSERLDSDRPLLMQVLDPDRMLVLDSDRMLVLDSDRILVCFL